MNNYSRKLVSKATNNCGALSSFAYGEKEVMKSNWFKSFVLNQFEGEDFYIPAGYHEILSQLYGDYITPPPVEMRVSHHDNKAYWK